LVEFIHLKKIFVIHQMLIQKMWCVEEIICIFNNILQKVSSKKSFLWESENDQKKDYIPWVLCHHWLIWLRLPPSNLEEQANNVLFEEIFDSYDFEDYKLCIALDEN
jgi:hypothetical protein